MAALGIAGFTGGRAIVVTGAITAVAPTAQPITRGNTSAGIACQITSKVGTQIRALTIIHALHIRRAVVTTADTHQANHQRQSHQNQSEMLHTCLLAHRRCLWPIGDAKS